MWLALFFLISLLTDGRHDKVDWVTDFCKQRNVHGPRGWVTPAPGAGCTASPGHRRNTSRLGWLPLVSSKLNTAIRAPALPPTAAHPLHAQTLSLSNDAVSIQTRGPSAMGWERAGRAQAGSPPAGACSWLLASLFETFWHFYCLLSQW